MIIKKSFVYEVFKSIRGLNPKEALRNIQHRLYIEEHDELPDKVKIETYNEVIDQLKREIKNESKRL